MQTRENIRKLICLCVFCFGIHKCFKWKPNIFADVYVLEYGF